MLTNFLEEFKLYIIGGLLAAVAVLCVLLYVQGERAARYKADAQAISTKLSVSNSSIDDLKDELRSVKVQLQKQEQEDAIKQAMATKALEDARKKNDALTGVSNKLEAAKTPSVVNTIPEDVKDAWTNL